ncbi:MAG: hypothetical protein ACI9GW_000922 [Halieaceae bacterium]
MENSASDSLCDLMLFAEICRQLEVNEYMLSGERRGSAAVSDAEFEVRNREVHSRLSRRQQIALMNMILAMTVESRR